MREIEGKRKKEENRSKKGKSEEERGGWIEMGGKR